METNYEKKTLKFIEKWNAQFPHPKETNLWKKFVNLKKLESGEEKDWIAAVGQFMLRLDNENKFYIDEQKTTNKYVSIASTFSHLRKLEQKFEKIIEDVQKNLEENSTCNKVKDSINCDVCDSLYKKCASLVTSLRQYEGNAIILLAMTNKNECELKSMAESYAQLHEQYERELNLHQDENEIKMRIKKINEDQMKVMEAKCRTNARLASSAAIVSQIKEYCVSNEHSNKYKDACDAYNKVYLMFHEYETGVNKLEPYKNNVLELDNFLFTILTELKQKCPLIVPTPVIKTKKRKTK
jgi:hypothetical protein